MNRLQLGTFSILLTIGLGTNTAWSSQNVNAMSAAESHANASKGAAAKSGKNVGASHEGLPSIVDEEDIPAFLITDPCDTGDS
jgi:hypothetical protein